MYHVNPSRDEIEDVFLGIRRNYPLIRDSENGVSSGAYMENNE